MQTDTVDSVVLEMFVEYTLSAYFNACLIKDL